MTTGPAQASHRNASGDHLAEPRRQGQLVQRQAQEPGHAQFELTPLEVGDSEVRIERTSMEVDPLLGAVLVGHLDRDEVDVVG